MKYLLIIGFFIILLLAQIECSAQKPDEALVSEAEKQTSISDTSSKEKKTELLLVTFVELGSVNCIPCKMMQPIMDEIEKEYAGQVKVVFHDVWTEEGKPYAQQYGIRAIPTQIFLDKDGNEYFRHTGFFPKEELVEVLKKQGVK